MLTIKTPTDLHQLPSNHSLYDPAKTLVEHLIIPYDFPERPYNADEEGFIVICEDGDQDGPLASIWPDEFYTYKDVTKVSHELNQYTRGITTLSSVNGGSSICCTLPHSHHLYFEVSTKPHHQVNHKSRR